MRRVALAMFAAMVAPLTALGQEIEARPKLELAEPIACSRIDGFDDYDALDVAVTKRSQKLLVYLRPSGVTYREAGGEYEVHLVLDVNLRRKGQKKILLGRKKVIDYETLCEQSGKPIYLGVSLGVKEFPPGEYEADLIVHDRLGESKPALRTLAFRIEADSPPAPNSSK